FGGLGGAAAPPPSHLGGPTGGFHFRHAVGVERSGERRCSDGVEHSASSDGLLTSVKLRRYVDSSGPHGRAAWGASDTTGRLRRLLALLQARPAWAGEELAKRLEVTDRTLRRGITRLRELGYPVEATPGRYGGY